MLHRVAQPGGGTAGHRFATPNPEQGNGAIDAGALQDRFAGHAHGRTYRLKIDVDLDGREIDYYIDGRLVAADAPFVDALSDVRYVTLMNYGSGPDSSTTWQIDELVVNTDAVQKATFATTSGAPRQSQTWEGSGGRVQETLRDEIGRSTVRTRAARVSDDELRYKPDFVNDGPSGDGTFAEVVSANPKAEMTGTIADVLSGGRGTRTRSPFQKTARRAALENLAGPVPLK